MTFDPQLLKPIFIEGLQKVAHWYQNDKTYYLRSIFDQVGFIDRRGDEPEYFVPPASLSSHLNYPRSECSESFDQIKKDTLADIEKNYQSFSQTYLKDLNGNQLFFLLEKFGGNVPNDETGEISIFDAYKIKAARAVIQHNRQKEGIGGYVSRGYGKIEFTFTEFCARALDFFRGSIDKITGKTSGEFSIAEARKEVENIINFLKEEF